MIQEPSSQLQFESAVVAELRSWEWRGWKEFEDSGDVSIKVSFAKTALVGFYPNTMLEVILQVEPGRMLFGYVHQIWREGDSTRSPQEHAKAVYLSILELVDAPPGLPLHEGDPVRVTYIQ
jgi:hypothetical protein